MSSLLKVVRPLFLLVLSGMVPLAAQAGSSAPSPTPPASDSSYPEQAYLSPSRYTNQYFGFSFELPADVHLRPISLPASRNGNILILELAGPAPEDAELSIAAIPTAEGNKQDAKAYLREELNQELYRGVEELRGLSKANLAQHQFFLYETRRGVDQHVLFATTLGDYILQVVVAAHDEKTVKRLETAFQHLEFFPPADVKQHLEADSKPYDGPAISSHRLAQLEENPPAKQIDAGKINGDFYENASLGFSYRIPEGWVLEPNGAVQPAIERYRTKEDFGRPRMGRVEHTLMDACSKTLFSAWAKRPGADGQVAYDEFGEVTVSAIAMSCFPTMKFPTDPNDVQAFRDFVAQFALTHPIVDDMGKGKVFRENDIVFLYLHGTVAFQIPNDELSRRLSLAMAMTERRGYLVTWFFAAPHDSELETLTQKRAIFDNNTVAKAGNTTQPGGGESKTEAPADASSFNAAETVKSAATANANGATTAPNADSTASGDPQANSSAATSGERPSLLRPGETMQNQQGKGAVIKPK